MEKRHWAREGGCYEVITFLESIQAEGQQLSNLKLEFKIFCKMLPLLNLPSI
tara:strand:- start:172 stop:327 length:156 start_codon:yes stop_codon:yes gene_type:complete